MRQPTGLVITALLLVVSHAVVSAQTSAQQKATGEGFTADANETFETLVAGIKTGLSFTFLRTEFFDKSMSNLRLSEESRWDPTQGSLGGVWSGQNSTGYVSVRIWSPDVLDKTKDHGLAIFQPATAQPIPEALLAHLLAKAEKTKLNGGRYIDLEFAVESTGAPKVQCLSRITLTIRLDSGALVANSLRTLCDSQKTSTR